MAYENNNKSILITPLNWGLGHATRCIPVIHQLFQYGYYPIIASDGAALQLLKKEFPDLKTLELPSYQIKYSKKRKNFKWKLLISIPKIARAILQEQKIVNQWIDEYQITGIISDNRLGCYSTKVPSVYITHQVTILSGKTTWLSSWAHQYFIKKYNECWIPDFKKESSLAGKLSHCGNTKLNLKHIGPLSRFKKGLLPKKYDLTIVLSGPEPQRGMLDTILQKEIKNYKGKVLYIKGIVEKAQKTTQLDDVTFFNFMESSQLEEALNATETILCRSGYTSIMDLAKLEKKAFFIPTPGQFEQEYLATKLEKKRIAPYSNQEDFTIDALHQVSQYSGFTKLENTVDWTSLLSIFNKKTDR